jgi:hypothetical protein
VTFGKNLIPVKNFFLFILILLIFSCKKERSLNQIQTNETYLIDSVRYNGVIMMNYNGQYFDFLVNDSLYTSYGSIGGNYDNHLYYLSSNKDTFYLYGGLVTDTVPYYISSRYSNSVYGNSSIFGTSPDEGNGKIKSMINHVTEVYVHPQ